MSNKSEQKRQLILERSRKVFEEKGFKDVTMKDIASACEISRGGLYLYFSSTEELFLDVLRKEAGETDNLFTGAVRKRAAASEILLLFLNEQKKELLAVDHTLSAATYEYAFAHPDDTFLREQFNDAVRIIEYLIRLGVRSGDFVCNDAKSMAMNIMLIVEGLKISARTMKITEAEVDQEIRFIMKMLGSAREEESPADPGSV